MEAVGGATVIWLVLCVVLPLLVLQVKAIACEGYGLENDDTPDPFYLDISNVIASEKYVSVNIEIFGPVKEEYDLVSAEFIEVKTELYSLMDFFGGKNNQRPIVSYMIHEHTGRSP